MRLDANGWLDVAEEISCIENSSSRNGRKIEYVVEHGTAGGSSAQNIARFFQGTIGSAEPASTHFIIGKDGHIVQCVPLSLAAWGNGLMTPGHAAFLPEGINPNYYTASIEYVKNQVGTDGKPDNSDPLTEAQKRAGFELTKCICDTYGVPKRAGDINGGVIGHNAIDPINRSRCPGNFPWNELWAYLKGEIKVGVPAGWKDENGVLTASNGKRVVRGFRDYILARAWDPNDVPLEEEQGANPVEEYYPAPGGTRQLFNYTLLAWASSRGVYRVGMGNELRGARADRDRYKSQVATLQSQNASLTNQTVDLQDENKQLQSENADLKEQNMQLQELLNEDEQAKQIAAQQAKIDEAIQVLQRQA